MFSLATPNMAKNLLEIWNLSFDDSPESTELFFKYRFKYENCAVYSTPEGLPVAMLNMIPTEVTEDNIMEPVQYIYGAATHPDYRGKGIMTSLLEFSRRTAELRRQTYQMLVPENRKLFDFYGKQGFETCFYVRKVYMSRGELITLLKKRGAKNKKQLYFNTLDAEQIARLRRDVFAEREGYVLWGVYDVGYAAQSTTVTGGEVFTVTDGIDAGCAFCREFDEGKKVVVSEFICGNRFEDEFIISLLARFPNCESFELRLPPYDGFFAEYGAIEKFGMLRSVSGKKAVNLLSLSDIHVPFLGLALD